MNFMESAGSKVADVIPKDLNLPPIPTIKSVKQMDISPLATVAWESVEDHFCLSHFNVYRSLKSDKDYVRINKIPLPPATIEFTDTLVLEYNKLYYYRISLSSKEGIESPLSGARL